MISFKRIVKNYEQAYKLGTKIIEHRNFIRQVPPENLEKEFNKQNASKNKGAGKGKEILITNYQPALTLE